MNSWNSPNLLGRLVNDRTTGQIEAILASLPIVDPEQYHWDYAQRRIGNWHPNHLHWLPVGLRRGNGGQVRLAGEPINPIAERLINAMEAIVELERLRELLKNPASPMPTSPRDAVLRYFGLPRLDVIEHMDGEERKALRDRIDEIRKRLVIRLAHDKKSSQFAITIRDNGMGQSPKHLHHTLLSLGESDKADKPYLIGLFGQGGSSAFMACKYSVVLSRRAGDVLQSGEDAGVGWSIVKQIVPKGRRDPYFAYLAAHEDGTVPSFDATVADKVNFEHGSQFSHIKYDFGGTESAVTRLLYQALNHVLFNPVLPYDLYSSNHKMIVRADDFDDVNALFDAFVWELGARSDGVLAVHNNFTLDGTAGRQRRPDVPADLRARTERFLIHQFMLTEGVDDPACTMLALYDPFSTERQLVQQIGRLTRHPGPIGTHANPALVISHEDDRVAQMWNRFLSFDDACVKNGNKPPVRNNSIVLRKLVDALPEMDYVAGKFRTRIDLEHGDLQQEISFPKSAVIFDLEDGFEMDRFRDDVSRALEEADRYESKVVLIEGGACRFHVSLRLTQSPFVSESLFQSASLDVTIYARHGRRLFFYDSAGLWIDDIAALDDRAHPSRLRSLIPDVRDSFVTSIAMKNTDLSPYAVRSRSLGARSLAVSGVFMGEHLHVVTRAAGRVGKVRRALGFARSNIREGDGVQSSASDFLEWTKKIALELEIKSRGASTFSRFALPIDAPSNPIPSNILIDIEEFAEHFTNESNRKPKFDLDHICVDVTPDGSGPKDFPYRFDMIVDGDQIPIWIKWDRKKQKFWLRSESLSVWKSAENDKISLTRRLNQRQPFRIVVSGSTSIYAFGHFYAVDLKLNRPSGTANLVRDLLQGVPDLSDVVSEKGNLKAAAQSWPQDSLFGVIDRSLRPGSRNPKFGTPLPEIFCDDLGNEVADFIGCDNGKSSGIPRAVFVVAKCKKGSDGVATSAMYDACAQAVKNLGYLKTDGRQLPGKPSSAKWSGPWKLNGAVVSRLRAGTTSVNFRDAFDQARSNPSTQRQIWMVLAGGMLSRKALVDGFAKDPPDAHVLQFYHLILSTYSACQSVGVDLKIFCSN